MSGDWPLRKQVGVCTFKEFALRPEILVLGGVPQIGLHLGQFTLRQAKPAPPLHHKARCREDLSDDLPGFGGFSVTVPVKDS